VDDAQATVSANDHSTPKDTLNHFCAIITISATAKHESGVDHDGGKVWAIGIEYQSLGLMFG